MLFWGWSFDWMRAFEDKSLVVTCEFSLRIKKAPWLVLWGFFCIGVIRGKVILL
jgi:hypothetical protein